MSVYERNKKIMLCKKCGCLLSDDATICKECGQKISSEDSKKFSSSYLSEGTSSSISASLEDPTEKKYADMERKSRMIRRIVLIVIAVVILIFILVYFLLFAGYKTPLRRYITGRESSGGSRYSKIVPNEFLDKIEEDYGMSRPEIRKCLDSYFNTAKSKIEEDYGAGLNFSYEVKSNSEITNENNIQQLEDEFLDKYDVKVDISKASTVNIVLKTEGSEKSTTEQNTLTFVKIGMKWYCMDAMEIINYACEYSGYNLW